MPPSKWPPLPKRHKSGRYRVRWKNSEHYISDPSTHQGQREYADLLARLAPPADHVPGAGNMVPAPSGQPPGYTVAEVYHLWLVEEAPKLGSAHEALQVGYAFRVALAAHGTLPADQFDAGALEQVRDAMVARGWAHRTIGQNVDRVKRVWRWAERKRLVPRGSWHNLRTLPALRANDPRLRPRAKRRPATWEELERALPFCSPPLRAALLVQWWSGCRSQDARRMRVGEVDRSGEVWLYRPGQHKGTWRGADRVVYLGPQAQEVLSPWLADKEPGEYAFPCRRFVRADRQGDWLRGERCYSRRTYGQAVSRAFRRAGCPGLQAYSCRHAAKDRITRERGLDAARAFLGQESIQVTDQYGSARDEVMALEVARRLG